MLLFCIFTLASCDLRYSEHEIHSLSDGEKSDPAIWLEYLDRKIAGSPKEGKFYYRKALILYSQSNISEAMTLMKTAVALEPDNMDYRYLNAQLFYASGNYVAGLREARTAESLGMTLPGLYELLGALYFRMGQLERSKEYLARALSDDPNNHLTHLYIGKLWLVQGDTTRATDAFAKSLELKYSIDALKDLIDISISTGNYSQALVHIDNALEQDSANQEILLQKADLLAMTGRTDSAKLILSDLLMEDSLNTKYLQRVGNIYYSLGWLDSAAYYQNKVLQIDQLNTEALLTLGQISDRRGHYGSAIDYYNRALGIDSAYQAAKDELQKLNNKIAYLRRLKQQEESRPTLKEIPLRPIAEPQL